MISLLIFSACTIWGSLPPAPKFNKPREKLFSIFQPNMLSVALTEYDVFTNDPPVQILVPTPPTIKVAIVYLFSSTVPKKTDGWAHDWDEAVRIAVKESYLTIHDVPYVTDFPQLYVGLSVEKYFKKYIAKSWLWNLYEYYVPEFIEHNEPGDFYPDDGPLAMHLWRERYPYESDQILSNNDIIIVIVNSNIGLGGVSSGTIFVSGIGERQHFDPTRPFINIESLRFLVAHEVMHLFGAIDHYTYGTDTTPVDLEIQKAYLITNCIMGDGYPPFGISYDLDKMPYVDPYILQNEIDWNQILKQNFDRPYNFIARYSIVHFYVALEYGKPGMGVELDILGLKQVTDDNGYASYWGRNNLIVNFIASKTGYESVTGGIEFGYTSRIDVHLLISSEPTPTPSNGVDIGFIMLALIGAGVGVLFLKGMHKD